jgi:putative restriction endonuclease
MQEFLDQEDAYHEWLETHPQGHVANLHKHHAVAQYPMVHRAFCASITHGERFTTGDYYKVCSDELAELQTWSLRVHAKPLTHCSTCMGLLQAGTWWVNHKQTFSAEIEGGYIWSPKLNKNGARNQTYVNLTLVRAGDLVISYASTLIKAIGIATKGCHEAPKPKAFGEAGKNWSEVGWLVPIEWTKLSHPIAPKSHIEQIAPLLPERNSPLQANGNGNQSCYLAGIQEHLGQLILSLAQDEDAAGVQLIRELAGQAKADDIECQLREADIPETEKEQLIRARRGQGLFRQRVLELSPRCAITGVEDQSFLTASHIKPWKDCSNVERLDGHNGLMLAPHADRLFDRGWISFEDDGQLLADESALPILEAWGIALSLNVGAFTVRQAHFLAYHRAEVFKGKR